MAKKKATTAFEIARDNFTYRTKSSDVSIEEQMAWWRRTLQTYAYDVEAVKAANIALYDLEKKQQKETEKAQKQAAKEAEVRRKQQVGDYKSGIAQMEAEDERWNEVQRANGTISENDFIYSLSQRAARYRQYADEVLQIDYMTEEERLALRQKYLDAAADAEADYQTKHMAYLRNRADREDAASRQYISDRNFYDDWDAHGDSAVDAYARVDVRNRQYLEEGVLSYAEYAERMQQFGRDMYNDRLSASENWISQQRAMDNLSADDHAAALERMRKYTEEYYQAGILSHRDYTTAMADLNAQVFAAKKAQHKEILAQIDEEKRALDAQAQARLDALQQEYNAAKNARSDKRRKEELAELKAQAALYQNAQTKEGKDHLAQIQDQIERLEEQERQAKEQADYERQRQAILERADAQKAALDRQAEQQALGLGLYFDAESGEYRMVRQAQEAFSETLTQQRRFALDSNAEMKQYNAGLDNILQQSYSTLSDGLSAQFAAFAKGVNDIKQQIFADVAAVNGLDFSKFTGNGGSGSQSHSTSVVYNDYGSKTIQGASGIADWFGGIGNLKARGLSI